MFCLLCCRHWICKPVSACAHIHTHKVQIITRPRNVIATSMSDKILISCGCSVASIDFSDQGRGLILD